MKRQLTSHRLVRRAALVAVAAVSLAGCGVLDAANAASVNGRGISDDRLQGELSAIRDNEQYRQALEAGFGGALTGDSEGTFDSVFAARVLTLQIYFSLAEQFLDDRGIGLGPDDLERARPDAVEQSGGQEVFDAFPEAYRELVVRRRAIVVAIDDALGEEFRREGAVEEYYDENPDEFRETCVSHLLVDTEERAASLRSRIERGASFADVARRESTDAVSAEQGGELGCRAAGTFVQEFEQAAAGLAEGELSQPVQSPFGWHLILVTERRVPPLSEVRTLVEQRLAVLAQEAFDAWLAEAASSADIDVNPRYGTWVAGQGGPAGGSVGEVVPPGGPTTTTSPPLPEG